MSSKSLPAVVLLSAVLASGLMWLLSQASNSSATSTRPGAMATPEELAISEEALRLRPPTVEIESMMHDFGYMNPHTVGQHEFVVRNVGERDLTLDVVTTSCKCTVGAVGKNKVAPGEETTITLEWDTRSKIGHFAHAAWINTNDPENVQLCLRVVGRVQLLAGVSADPVIFNNLRRGQPSTESVFIHSPQWQKLKVENITCSMPEAKWELVPATTEELAELESKVGYRLQVTAPAFLSAGNFQILFTFDLVPGSEDQAAGHTTLPCQVRFEGNVPATMTLAGRRYERAEGLLLGRHKQGEGDQAELILLVRQFDKPVTFSKVTCTPEVLDVQVKPDGETENGTLRYLVQVTLPPKTPACAYMGPDAAMVHLVADDPDLPVVSFPVQFAVTD